MKNPSEPRVRRSQAGAFSQVFFPAQQFRLGLVATIVQVPGTKQEAYFGQGGRVTGII